MAKRPTKKKAAPKRADANKLTKAQQAEFDRLIQEGEKLIENKEFKAALAHYNDVVKRFPNESEAWSDRGAVKNDIKQYLEAIEDLNKAIELDKNSARAWNNRGYAKSSLSRYAEAITDYTEAIRLDPKDCEILNNRGWAFLKLNQLDESEADYNKAFVLDPKNQLTRIGLFYIEAKRATDRQTQKIKESSEEETQAF